MIPKKQVTDLTAAVYFMLAISITVLYVLFALEYIMHRPLVSDLLLTVVVLLSVTAGSVFFGAYLKDQDSPAKKMIICFLQNTLRYFLAFIFFYYAFTGFYGNRFESSLTTLNSRLYTIEGPELARRFLGYSREFNFLIGLLQVLCGLLLLFRRTTLVGCVFGFGMMFNIAVISFTHGIQLKVFSVLITLMFLYFILLQFDRVKAFVFQGKIILLNRLPVYLTQTRYNFFHDILVKFFFSIALLFCCFKEWKMKDDHSSVNPLLGIWQFATPAKGAFANGKTIIFDKGGEGELNMEQQVIHFTYSADSSNKQVLIWGMSPAKDTTKAVYSFVSAGKVELSVSDTVIAKLKKEF